MYTHTHTQVHTLWDTHLAVCQGTCFCTHCTVPQLPDRMSCIVHSPSPESEREKGREEEREGVVHYYTKLIDHT